MPSDNITRKMREGWDNLSSKEKNPYKIVGRTNNDKQWKLMIEDIKEKLLINKINKKIKEEIEVDNVLIKRIDINMKNAINKILHDYKLQQ